MIPDNVVYYESTTFSNGAVAIHHKTTTTPRAVLDEWIKNTGFTVLEAYDPEEDKRAFIFEDSFQASIFRIAWQL